MDPTKEVQEFRDDDGRSEIGVKTVVAGRLTVRQPSITESSEHIFAVKCSPDGKYTAATFGNGVIRIFDGDTLTSLQRARIPPPHDDNPSTSVKWRPSASGTVYELASSSSGGALCGWKWDVRHMSSSFLERIYRHVEEGNDTACIDYSPDGKLIATGGSDRNIRIYDVDERRQVGTLYRGFDSQGLSRPAHSNRIFSVKYASPTVLLSGGWENPVQVWDTRTGRAERQLGGPQVASDAIEVFDTFSFAMIASNRNHTQLQVFDYVSGREIVEDGVRLSKGLGRMSLLGARYQSSAQLVWCIASEPDALVCIDYVTGEVRGVYENIQAPFYALDCPSNRKNRCVFAGAKQTLLVVDCDVRS